MSSTEEEIISIVPEEYRFKTSDKDNIRRSYVLRSAYGDGRETYLNNLSSRMGRDDEGNATGIRDFKGLHEALLCHCLYVVNPDGSDTLLDAEGIRALGWPSPVIKKLFDRAKVLSALDEEAPAKGKKS